MISLAYPWVLLLALLPLLLANRKQQSEPVDAPVIPVGHWLSGMPGVSPRGRSTPLWRQLLLLLGWLCLVVRAGEGRGGGGCRSRWAPCHSCPLSRRMHSVNPLSIKKGIMSTTQTHPKTVSIHSATNPSSAR